MNHLYSIIDVRAEFADGAGGYSFLRAVSVGYGLGAQEKGCRAESRSFFKVL